MMVVTKALRKLAKGSGSNVNILKDMTWGQRLSAAGTAAAGVMGYNQARSEGASVPGALAQATVDAFMVDLIGWKAYLGGAALMQAPSLTVNAYEKLNIEARKLSQAGIAKPFQGNTFVDSQQVYTMRQAGLAMMDQSKQNLKQVVMGNEAQALHR